VTKLLSRTQEKPNKYKFQKSKKNLDDKIAKLKLNKFIFHDNKLVNKKLNTLKWIKK
jgi:hypothetical protein